MNQVLILELAIPNRSPIAEQTPKACNSRKSLSFCIFNSLSDNQI